MQIHCQIIKSTQQITTSYMQKVKLMTPSSNGQGYPHSQEQHSRQEILKCHNISCNYERLISYPTKTRERLRMWPN